MVFGVVAFEASEVYALFGRHLILAIGLERKVSVDGSTKVYECDGVLNYGAQIAGFKPDGLSVPHRC